MSTLLPSTPLRGTPLQSSPQPPLSTPIHSRDSVTSRSDITYDDRNTTLQHLAEEMEPFVVSPIPTETFLNLFMPPPSAGSPPFKKGMFSNLIQIQGLKQAEETWYDVFINIISQHLKNLNVVNTSKASGESPNTAFLHALMPDCSVFRKDYKKPEKPKKQHFDFNHVELIIEFKKELDPFVDNLSDTSNRKKVKKKSDNPFLDNSSYTDKSQDNASLRREDLDRLEVLGQLTAYATAILSAQYRTHLFMVFIVDEHARLIRWDRAGAVVTELIPFDDDPFLFDFFMRYDIATREVRGHDSTVTVSSKDEIKRAKSVVDGWDKIEAFFTITMSNRDRERCFIVPRSDAQAISPVGRWTRSSVAFDVQEKCQVYLKDSWRVILSGIESEGTIYRLLHEKGVPNIPPCLVDGDVGDDNHHKTQTQHVVEKHVRDPHRWNLTPHRHYRIVLGVVGRRLEQFTRTRELVNAMHAALKAHEAAHTHGVLHRDISSGNILIVGPKELHPDKQQELKIDGGMLIDWDLSKYVKPGDEHSAARNHERTGTWRFMAADLVLFPGTKQTFAHDLESFFWVLLWMVLTYVETSWKGAVLSTFIENHFKPKLYKQDDGVATGTTKKDFLTHPKKLTKDDFQITGNPTLVELLVYLKRTVSSRFDTKPSMETSEYEANADPNASYEYQLKEYNTRLWYMKDHSEMLRVFSIALGPSKEKDWPDDDKGVI